RGQRAPGLGDDVRHREFVLAARLGEGVDDVVRVLLHRVVHARRDGRARAVVIDAESAAHVDVPDVDAHPPELDVEARDFGHREFDVADVGDLRAEVEVDHLEDVQLPRGLELVDHPHELGRVQPELAALARGLGPAAGARRGELDPDARDRVDVHLLGHAEDRRDLARLLDHDDDLVPELLAHEREADELLVLVAVADDQVVRPLRQREDRLELRLAADLEADAVRLAEGDDLLDDVALLIDLDRVDRGVPALVVELADRGPEPLREPDDARAQDVREAKEQREPDALGLQVHRHLEEVQPAIRITGRVDGDVPLLVDAKVADPPAVDVVQLAGIVYRPAHRFGFSSTFVARACRRGARPRVRRRSHGPFRADALLLAGAEWYPISPAGERVPADPHRRSASRAR